MATWQYLFSHVLQKIIKSLIHRFKIDQHANTSYFKILAGLTNSRKNSYDKLLIHFTFNIRLMYLVENKFRRTDDYRSYVGSQFNDGL